MKRKDCKCECHRIDFEFEIHPTTSCCEYEEPKTRLMCLHGYTCTECISESRKQPGMTWEEKWK